jgi:hypothetical protein
MPNNPNDLITVTMERKHWDMILESLASFDGPGWEDEKFRRSMESEDVLREKLEPKPIRSRLVCEEQEDENGNITYVYGDREDMGYAR